MIVFLPRLAHGNWEGSTSASGSRNFLMDSSPLRWKGIWVDTAHRWGAALPWRRSECSRLFILLSIWTVYKVFEILKNTNDFPQTKVTSWNCLFCQSISQTPQDIHNDTKRRKSANLRDGTGSHSVLLLEKRPNHRLIDGEVHESFHPSTLKALNGPWLKKLLADTYDKCSHY